MARRRKNASFTLDQTYGSGHGDRTLIQGFYARLNELIPGDTSIPIPPESQIRPQHDAETQAFIFADYAVREIAPLALRAAGLDVQYARLMALKPVFDEETALAAANAANAASVAARAATFATANAAATAHYADYGDSGYYHEDYYHHDSHYAAVAAEAAEDAAVYIGDSYNVNIDRVGAAAANAANAAAALNPDATWAAVNEMLQAL